MPIISVSLNDKMLKEIDKIQRKLGFSGRSEVIREGARMLIADNKEKEKLSGKLNSVLLLTHNRKNEGVVDEIKHKFGDIITTQIHNCLQGNTCLEIFVLEGDAERIKQLVKSFQISKKIEYAKLVVA